MSDYTEHARLSPSGSKGWFACAGKIRMESTIADTPKPYADAGTAMHAVAAWCLTEHYPAVKRVGDSIPVHSENEEPRLVGFDEEMADLVQGYVDTVRRLGVGNQLLIEQRVDFSEFVGEPDQFGTADAIIYDDRDGELMVIDLKTGHTPVEVDNNSQLMIYALGALRLLLDGDLAADATTPFLYAEQKGILSIRLGIYQPKLREGLAEWRCTLGDLMAFTEMLRTKAAMVREAEKDAEFMPAQQWQHIYLNPTPNEVECAFCKAMPTCPAAARAVEESVGADFEEVIEGHGIEALPTNPDDVLGKQMASVGFIEDWCLAVRAEVERRLLTGGAVPGFGLELGRKPPRKWGDPATVEETLRHKFKVNYEGTYNMKLKSPTQLEALCDPKKNEKPVLGPRQWKVMQALITQGDPSPSVKPATTIKNPYIVPKLDEGAFAAVPEDCDLV